MNPHVTAAPLHPRRAGHARQPRPFNFTRRRAALAVQLFCALQAGQSFAGCVLDDQTLTSPLTNASLCSNGSTATITSTGAFNNTATGVLNNTATGTLNNAGKLNNQGTLNNSGWIRSAGLIESTGSFTNTGALTIFSGGKASIASATNLKDGTLTGGYWEVDGSSEAAYLSLGNGTLTTNEAVIALRGAQATFEGLTALQENAGTLVFDIGARFTSASLHNTGTLAAGYGATVNIVKALNLSNGTLTGGTWIVSGGTLTIGSGNISTNAAVIRLHGTNSSLSQLDGLKINAGTLVVEGAQLNQASFRNTGTLIVDGGGEVNFDNATANVNNGTLLGGNWVVSNGTLILGTGNITTNAAQVSLYTPNASFAQLDGLTENRGSLTLGYGATFTTQTTLLNTGTLATLNDGVLQVGVGGIDNKGVIDNGGTFNIAGNLNGGTFNNTGTLNVAIGSDVRIKESSNLKVATQDASGTPTAYDLAGGTWIVGTTPGAKAGSSATASLIFGNGGAIRSIAAGTRLELIGTKVVTNDLTQLESNAGELGFSSGAGFTGVIGHNTGTVTVANGASVNISDTLSLTKGTLSEGTWIVDTTGINGANTKLVINGGAAITSNAAQIELHGGSKENSAFAQIAELRENTGTFVVADGASYSSTALYNTGTLSVENGGTVSIASSKNLSSGTSGNVLSGGTWVVNGGSLSIGASGIGTNAATIELRGAGSSLTQIADLRYNTGTFIVADGASYAPSKSKLENTGILQAGPGGTIALLSSPNFSNGTLTGGHWVVDNGTMSVGTDDITTNAADITYAGGAASFAQLAALANNKGALVVTQGARFVTKTSLTNTGTLVVDAGSAYLGSAYKSELPSLVNSGTLAIHEGARVSGLDQFIQTAGVTELRGGVLEAQSVEFLGGELIGSGTIDPPSPITIGSGALVRPEGALAFAGDTQFDGTLDIRIASVTDFGSLYVYGSIVFGTGSAIQIAFDPDFVATASSYAFDFLGASGDMSGLGNAKVAFAGLAGYSSKLASDCTGGGCSYSLLLSTTPPVPEPGTAPMMVTGIAALGWLLRRRGHALSRFC